MPNPNQQPPPSAFKPVPPPKPKNYRPPMQGTNGGQWENGVSYSCALSLPNLHDLILLYQESMSPRSPNGFYYSTPTNPPHPAAQSHQHYHHQSMTNGTSASPHYSHHQFGNNGGNPHSNYGQPLPPPPHMQSPPMFGNNGYNNHHQTSSSHYGSGNYSHRNGFGK